MIIPIWDNIHDMNEKVNYAVTAIDPLKGGTNICP